MESMLEFFAMGGHGFYIWLSYGAALVMMLGETMLVWHRHNKARKAFDKIKSQMGAQETMQ
ncbi:MAG: heme exporter protein CcmD [Hydrogenovibrio sp.]|uniref:heme exporter protein CcmD n=1 Tax=Hydrogenovibrio sp. TaxID=2065821 RepID=UPI0028708D4B|nr:heme exporter protein CcmD [Hydrogenovibrio sp.]MDR9499900.1 heme exporter protein CcmD [Hydrogenovibrio sp.]